MTTATGDGDFDQVNRRRKTLRMYKKKEIRFFLFKRQLLQFLMNQKFHYLKNLNHVKKMKYEQLF